MSKKHVKKGDLVEIIAGRDKDKRGKVVAVYPDSDRVKVENCGMIYKHKRVDAQNNTGGRTREEGTIHISNVMLVDPKTDKPSRTRVEIKDGKRTRVFVKSGNAIE